MQITSERAAAAIAAGEMRANAIGIPVNIAILDAGAHLKAFVRMDGAVLGSIDVAIAKARTAVLFQVPSDAVWEYCKPGAPAPGLERSNGGLATFAGGIPLFDAGRVPIGAVGVSGGAVPQDLEIARAAAAAIGDRSA
ncbi:MAG: heme-binding protein [Alphaproteobacteria bacterium]|nr:heme-binding protein [Alphaproteobacteria bacterium]